MPRNIPEECISYPCFVYDLFSKAVGTSNNVPSYVELGRIWKESVLSSFQVMLLSGGTEEIATHFGKKSSDKACSPPSGHTLHIEIRKPVDNPVRFVVCAATVVNTKDS
jgi:hypothetical protein